MLDRPVTSDSSSRSHQSLDSAWKYFVSPQIRVNQSQVETLPGYLLDWKAFSANRKLYESGSWLKSILPTIQPNSGIADGCI